jgi:two-component system response regulator FixJ
MEERPAVTLVDDEVALHQLVGEVARKAGFQFRGFLSAQDFRNNLKHIRAGCVLIDVRLPDMDGLQLLRLLAAERFALPVIIITGYGNVPIAVQALKSGAFDFIEKPFTPEQLRGRVAAAIEVHRSVGDRDASSFDLPSRLARLTPREREILQLIVRGKSPREIASLLHITRKTLDVHRGRIRDKMAVETETALVRLLCLGLPGVASNQGSA